MAYVTPDYEKEDTDFYEGFYAYSVATIVVLIVVVVYASYEISKGCQPE